MNTAVALREELMSRPVGIVRFYCLILGETICSWLANGMLMISLGWWALETKFKFLGSSTVEVFFFIPPIFLAIYIGKLSDKMQPVYLVRSGILLKLISAGVMAWVIQWHVGYHFIEILIFALLISTGDSIIDPSITGYTAKLLRKKTFARFVAARPLFIDLSFLCGGLIAAPILKMYGLQGIILSAMCLYVIASAVVLSIPPITLVRSSEHFVLGRFSKIQENAVVHFLPLMLASAVIFFFGLLLLFVLVYPKEHLQANIEVASYMNGAFVVGLAVAMGYMWIWPIKNNIHRVASIICFLCALSVPIMLLGTTYIVAPLVVMMFFGMLLGYLSIYFDRLWISQHAVQKRGEASGKLFFTTTTTRIAGIYGFGTLSTFVSMQAVILFMTVYLFILAACITVFGKQLNVLDKVGTE